MASRGNFFGPAPGVQDVVSGEVARKQAEGGLGRALEGLLALRVSEQEAARDLFKTLSQTNPELIGTIIRDKPDALKALIQTPSTLRQKGEVDPSDQIIDAFTFAAKNAPVETLIDLEPSTMSEIMQDSLKDLTPEALKDPEAIKTYWQFRAGKDVETRALAGTTLAQAGFIQEDIRGIAGEADALSKWLTSEGRPTSPIQAFELLNNSELREQVMLLQMAMTQQNIERGEQINPLFIAGFQREITSARRRISGIEKELASFEELSGAPSVLEDLSPEGQRLANIITGGDIDFAKAITAREEERASLLKRIRVLEELMRSGGKQKTVPTGEKINANDLFEKIKSGN